MVSNNAYYQVGTTPPQLLKGVTDSTAITVDPMFVDPAMHDYHPQPGPPASPLIGAGVDIPGISYDMTGKTPRTSPPDIGALQHRR